MGSSPVSFLECALFLSQKRGISVVPIEDGLKMPPKGVRWKNYQTEIMKEKEVRGHFGYANRMALITGKVSNHLECIDFDMPGRYDEWRQILDDNGHADLTARLVVESTPRGGAHVYYHCPDGIESNQKLALRFATLEELALKPAERAKATIETRGEGGLVVVQPSDGYKPIQGKMSEIPILTGAERRLLINIARSFNEAVEQSADLNRKEQSADNDGKPGSDFNTKSSWPEVLEPLGWRYLYPARGRDYWERPGKSQKDVSATTGNGANDLLYVFSTSCYPLDSERCYSRFAVYAICNHNGDFSAAAKNLSSRGFGSRPVEKPTQLSNPNTSAPPKDVSHLNGHKQVEDTALPSAIDGAPETYYWNPVSYAALLSMPPKPMLIDGLIGECDNFMIFGLPKSGKTFVTIDLLMTCVSGGEFAGCFQCLRPLNVAYLTNEGLGKLPERLSGCAQFNGTQFDDVQSRLHVFMDVPQLYTEEGAESIVRFSDEWLKRDFAPLDLLIIDTLNKATLGADENSNSDAAIVSKNLRYAREKLHCATGLIHHSGKSGESVRGASAYDGDLDFQLRVSRDEIFRSMSLVMAKDLSGFEDLTFKLSQVNETCAVSWLGSKELSKDKSALAHLVLMMRLNPDKEWWTLAQIHENTTGFTRDALRMAMVREAASKSETDAMIKVWIDGDGKGANLYSVRR